VIGQDGKTGQLTFCDCSLETPSGRRSLCYDREAREARKENKPQGSAVEMATAMGVDVMTEEQYRNLQELGEFDTKTSKTSSWIQTPPDVRSLGGALFCDRRYGKVFVYHNGAQSLLRGKRLPRFASGLSAMPGFTTQSACGPEKTHRSAPRPEASQAK
jgi:hypothetical protein